VSSTYRFSAPFAARLLGVGLVVVGLAVLVLVALLLALSAPQPALSVVIVAGAAAVVLLGVLSVRRGVVVRLDENGYRVRLVRGAGVRQADWRAVEDVVAATVAGDRCVVLRLRDGRTTTLPVAVLEGRAEDFVADLRGHLNRGHGYRPVPGRR
jgi:hypothetical protein